jgi:hypothetical protein
MANTYTWIIEQMDCYPANPEPDYVFNVHWRCNGVDEATPPNQATVYSIQAIPNDPSEPYIPYANLTPDIVIGWVQEAMGADGVAAVLSSLDKQLAALENPPVVSPPLPW